VTKAEIAQSVHEHVGLSKKESGELVDSVLNTIRQTLTKGENVKISGFGHFMVRSKHERPGRNPKTGDEIKISSRHVVTFRASRLLKQKLAGGDE